MNLQIQVIVRWIISGILLSGWAALFLFIGYRWGWYRGVNDRDKKQREELTQTRMERIVAEERLETERRVSKRLEIVLTQMTANRQEEPTRLRVAK